jgi:hypothetical protein
MKNCFLVILFSSVLVLSTYGQEDNIVLEESMKNSKNQFSTNVPYLLFNSLELNYERVLGRKFAVGIGWSTYGKGYDNLNLEGNGYNDKVNYEINPYGRLYFNGNQKKSHYLEVFASINESEKSDQFVRNTTNSGFGVYELGIEKRTTFGMGIGYGYRFLLANDRLVLEAQFGIRTNFDFYYGIPDPSIVRAGIRIGYRF